MLWPCILICYKVGIGICNNYWTFASSLRKLFSWKKIEILVSEYLEWSKTSRNMICVHTLISNFRRSNFLIFDFLIFKPLKFINGLRYRVTIWYSSEAVTSLQSWRFSCKLIPNLKFYEILNFFKIFSKLCNLYKLWVIKLKICVWRH